MTPTPINSDAFYHDGRGPLLQRVHWGSNGFELLAIDHFNPDDAHGTANLKHVRFSGMQVVMITPEEVIGVSTPIHERAAMFDRGRDAWFLGFNPHHLAACTHYQLLFYDELFDVIASGIECRQGGFGSSGGS